MTKVARKKNRKLRRQIRKTIGALLMVSAIVVAAIPVTGVNADAGDENDETVRIKVVNYTDSSMNTHEVINGNSAASTDTAVPAEWKSKVPYVDNKASIYTTGTSGNVNFQFAFVRPAGEADQVAVILGATINNLPDNSLTIPETVDAYKKYTANTTSTGYCAVNRSDEFLYYKTKKQEENINGELLFTSSKTPNNGTQKISPSFNDKYSVIEDSVTKNVIESMELQSDGTTYKFVITKTYKTQDQEGNEEEKTDVEKYDTFPCMIETMNTCDYDNQGPWIDLLDSELYYWNGTGTVDLNDVDNFALALTPERQRIHDAKVQYIGRQYLLGTDGEWSVQGTVDPENNPSNGVFAGKGQIVNLTIGDNLLGIGDAAFYGCGGIQSVTLGNGLSTIGNSAFANCINMSSCNMQLYSEITAIGKNAFLNCRALKNITMPTSVKAIGDYCFKGCSSLESIELCGNGNNVQLNAIGYMAFQNCSSLSSITFPESFYQDSTGIPQDEQNGIPILYFNGCTSMQFIKIENTILDIIDGTNVTTYNKTKSSSHTKDTNDDINKFLMVVSDSFYFEGPDKVAAYSETDSPIHLTAKIHSSSFKYLDEDKYERVVACPELDSLGEPLHYNTFIINTLGELLEMDIDNNCKEVDIPSKIGAYGILELSSDSFKHKCFLEKITIPSSITLIESGAFEGCHRLKHVIFEQQENSGLIIQDGAFNTQVVDPLLHVEDCDPEDDNNKDIPTLTFTGTISESSPTYQYATNPNNNINRGTQPTTYITFYSGWPTNLTVQYNQDTQKNELIDYPKYDELTSYTEDLFPYMTAEMVSAASTAVSDYESWKNSGYSQSLRPTEDEMAIVNSALNPVLPAGITAIKSGIFSDLDSDGKVVSGGTKANPNTKVESVTCNTVETIEPYTFAGCTGLTGFWMNGGTKIDDYAFKNCGENLVNVGIGSSVSELGKRPFAGCTGLSNVVFTDNPNFTCEEAIIYGTTDGVKDTIVECLEGRGLLQEVSNTQVGPDELAGITTIMPEAFKDCDEIVTVDLSSSSVTSIPEQCFAQTDRLSTVILPNGTVKSIDKGAFWNSSVANVRIPDKSTLIELQAFANVEEDADGEIILDTDSNPTIKNVSSGHRNITFNCPDDSFANTYADKYYYINTKAYEYYKVVFKDGVDFSTLSEQTVMYGEEAKEPTPKEHDGLTFTGWDSDGYKYVIEDGTYYAQYSGAAYSVTYVDGVTSTVMSKETVEAGKNGNPPTPLTHEGYTFVEWRPSPTGVTEDLICVAYYKDNSGDSSRHKCTFYGRDGSVVATYSVNDKETVTPPAAPTVSGYTFISWIPKDFTNITEDKVYYASYEKNSTSASASPSSSASKSASPSPSSTSGSSSNNNGDNTKKYTVSVSGGSGSGSYAAGAIVALNAYDMGVGKEFDKWTTSTAGVGFANAEATSTTFTMPAANVAITATYKTGSTSSSNTSGNSNSTGGSSSGGGSSSNGSSGSNSNRSSGTTVEVTKPGISNTNLAGATVAGSTDNFVVKVTEDQTANDLAVQALQAKFGDISRVKYLPMDISLYDSTGRTKIADTSGISVNITLPLPDDLAQYAGNNKVASTLGGTIEDLNTRFTTVDGVPCVNFTATHFSPYVIYVDTANLTAGTIDATPKTGDPIHPKWFLAIGLASLSLILFFKRDRKVPKTGTA